MADMCYYGNVMTTRWRICVTLATLWQQQDGGYVLLWKRYDNNKMADMCYYGNVMTTTRWRKQVQSLTVYDSLWQSMTVLLKMYNKIYNKLSMTVVLLLDVYTELVIYVFYIFNSTVIDWTWYIFFIFNEKKGKLCSWSPCQSDKTQLGRAAHNFLRSLAKFRKECSTMGGGEGVHFGSRKHSAILEIFEDLNTHLKPYFTLSDKLVKCITASVV